MNRQITTTEDELACACGARHPMTHGGRIGQLLAIGVLFIWGATMLHFHHSQRVEHYLAARGSFREQCLICGVGLIMLAVINLGFLLGKKRRPVAGSNRFKLAPWLAIFAIMIVPFVAATLRSPDRFSDEFFLAKVHAAAFPVPLAHEKNQRVDFSVEELVRLCGGLNAEGHVAMKLSDVYQLASQSRAVIDAAQSLKIEMTGMAVHDPQDPTCWRLSRLMITCCAADAQAVSVPVDFSGDRSVWQQLSWFKTIGTIQIDSQRQPQMATFRAERVEPVAAPEVWNVE
ncbi:MAG: hypothetical protein EAZ42_05585 [Verrucomicrobia bacterium]|nr:MAG: hypothetical protein EAZ42_05585 [Verrucomicrobiota bacterium]